MYFEFSEFVTQKNIFHFNVKWNIFALTLVALLMCQMASQLNLSYSQNDHKINQLLVRSISMFDMNL
jgi:hypothetical protein